MSSNNQIGYLIVTLNMTCQRYTRCHKIRWYIRFTIQLFFLIGHRILTMLGLVWLQGHTPKGYVQKTLDYVLKILILL